MNKICKGCKKEKKIEDFYVHAQMDDGHLGFCKNCVKERVSNRYYSNHQRMLIKERERYRKRKHNPIFTEKRVEYQRQYRTLEMQKAHNMAKRNLVRPNFCEICGKPCKPEGHHPNYSEPLRVMWCCSLCHKMIHKNIRAGGFLSPPSEAHTLLLPTSPLNNWRK